MTADITGQNGAGIIDWIVGLANSAGLLGMLVAILYGGYRKVWVWGTDYQKVETDRDEWKALALRGLGLAERSVAAIKKDSV